MGLLPSAETMRLLLGFAPPPPPPPPITISEAMLAATPGAVRAPAGWIVPITGPSGPLEGYPSGTLTPPPVVTARNGMPVGRYTWDNQLQLFGANTSVVIPPDTALESWRVLNLDADVLKSVSANRLLQILSDASPDVSRALFDAHTMVNPGFEALAYQIDSPRQPHKKGQKAVDQFFDLLGKQHGAPDVVINRGTWSFMVRGAFMAELVLDEDGRMPVDLATPDPISARFLENVDARFGPQYVLGQFQGPEFVPLSGIPTVQYVPLHPAAGTAPYGRPPFAPAIFASVFLMGLLHDLRRVVAQQGYPRYDLAINLDRLRLSFQQAQADPATWAQWVSDTIAEVNGVYNALQPDSAFIHTDVVTVNRPTGAVNADVLNAVDSLVRALERLLARALKTMPLLLGTGDSTNEANSNRQWEIHSAGIGSVQNLMAQVWSRLLTLMCEAQGIPCKVEMQFAVLRQAEAFRDAQTEAQQIQNEINKFYQGWTTQNEGALKIVGHPAAEPEPRQEPKAEVPYEASPPAGGPPVTVGQGTGGGAPDNEAIADQTKQAQGGKGEGTGKPGGKAKPAASEEGEEREALVNGPAPMMAVWMRPSRGARAGRVLRWIPDPRYSNGHDETEPDLPVLERIA